MSISLKIRLAHLGNLLFGMYQNQFSERWDSRLNELLDKGEVVGASQHTLHINHQGNSIEVWCENRWYGFGNEYRVNGRCVVDERRYRPRLKTMLKLWNVYQTTRNARLDENYLNLFEDDETHA